MGQIRGIIFQIFVAFSEYMNLRYQFPSMFLHVTSQALKKCFEIMELFNLLRPDKLVCPIVYIVSVSTSHAKAQLRAIRGQTTVKTNLPIPMLYLVLLRSNHLILQSTIGFLRFFQ